MPYSIETTATGDGTTTSYEIPFPFLRAGDLVVTIDAVTTTDFTRPNASTILFDSAPANNAAIVITRSTNIDDPAVDFSEDSALFAADIDAAVGQVLYKVQELETAIAEINVGAGGTLPVPGAASRFLMSTNATDWAVQTVAQVQTTLGIAAAVAVPSAVSGNRFLITNASTNTYELQTLAQIQDLLGIGAELPTATSSVGFLSCSSAVWSVVTAGTARTRLGLGELAIMNEGTSYNEVPALINRVTTGTYAGVTTALKQVSGENLVDVAKYSHWSFECYLSAPETLATAYTATYASGSDMLHLIEPPSTSGQMWVELDTYSGVAARPSWLTFVDPGTGSHVTLSAGTYDSVFEVEVEATFVATNQNTTQTVNFKLYKGTGSVLTDALDGGTFSLYTTAASSETKTVTLRRTIRVPAATSVVLSLHAKTSSGTVQMNFVRFNIWKMQ